MGQGYGGFVALHSIARGSIKCGVVTSPVSSLNDYGMLGYGRFIEVIKKLSAGK